MKSWPRSVILYIYTPPENALVADRNRTSLSVSGSKAATNHFVWKIIPDRSPNHVAYRRGSWYLFAPFASVSLIAQITCFRFVCSCEGGGN